MSELWYSLDFETSSQNKYACEIDRVCVAEFDIETGEVHNEWDYNSRGKPFKTIGCVLQRYTDYSSRGRKTTDPDRARTDAPPTVMHNATFDLYLLEKVLGFELRSPIYDTMLMARHWRNDLPAYDLKSLAWLFFGDTYEPLGKLQEWIRKQQLKGEEDPDLGFDMTKPPDKLVHNYCTHDVRMTAKLAHLLYPKVKDNYAFQLDTALIRPLMEAEAKGITVDVEYLKDFVRRGKRRIRYNRKKAGNRIGTDRNPMGKALRKHLEDLGETRRTPTGKVKSDESVLKDWTKVDKAVGSVQRVRTDEKLVHTYAQNLLDTVLGSDTRSLGTFHPGFIQSGAVTRRFRAASMYGDSGVISKGQVQNVPRGEGIRTAFTVPTGYAFVKLDLASIEARLAAHAMSVFLDDDFFAARYRRSDKFNIYLHVASKCAGEKTKKGSHVYTAYKHGCLGIQYGVGVRTFHRTLVEKFDLPYSESECAQVYRNIRRLFPSFSRLQRVISEIVLQQGFIVDDFGAIYYVPESEVYKSVNYYCQGCAGNILKWWWVRVHEMMQETGDYVFSTVHDELDMAVKRDRGSRSRVKDYCSVLNELALFSVPIIAESSGLKKNWGECG